MKKVFNTLLTLAVMIGGLSFTSCEEPEVVGKLELTVSKKLMVADGNDEVILTAISGDVDVTEEALFYVNNTPMGSNVFTTQKASDYKFFASYKGSLSNQITVSAANPALYVALPEDSQPDLFGEFERNILLTEATGTWCGYCPYMIRALELFKENGSNAGNTVIVATHSGDTFSSDASEAAVQAAQVPGFPSSVLNLDPNVLIENAQPEVNAEYINSMVGMELRESARVGISATVATNQDSSVVAVRAAIKVGVDGNYRINAWLIEDSVAASQSSYWPEFSNGMSSVVIDHMHILRGASCVSPIQGKFLGDKENHKAGTTVEFYHEFSTKENKIKNVANCKVAVMVTAAKGTSKKFFVNNIVECAIGESAPFAYK